MRAVKNIVKSKSKMPLGIKVENRVEMGYAEVWKGWLAPEGLGRLGKAWKEGYKSTTGVIWTL